MHGTWCMRFVCSILALTAVAPMELLAERISVVVLTAKVKAYMLNIRMSWACSGSVPRGVWGPGVSWNDCSTTDVRIYGPSRASCMSRAVQHCKSTCRVILAL